MKNDQGFLPNRLNKYAIRKFTVGTASLLIGATLVFGVSNEAQADELATIKKMKKLIILIKGKRWMSKILKAWKITMKQQIVLKAELQIQKKSLKIQS